MAVQTDIRVLSPRVQRAVEGVIQSAWTLNADQVKDLVADALADVILYTGSAFGKTLIVTAVDGNGAPDEYATSDELTIAEQGVIAAQAALNWFFFRYVGQKVSERIADEGEEWSWAVSANLLTEQLKALIAARDRALEVLEGRAGIEEYVSFLAVRDCEVARAVEPWAAGAGLGGQQVDYRFGTPA